MQNVRFCFLLFSILFFSALFFDLGCSAIKEELPDGFQIISGSEKSKEKSTTKEVDAGQVDTSNNEAPESIQKQSDKQQPEPQSRLEATHDTNRLSELIVDTAEKSVQPERLLSESEGSTAPEQQSTKKSWIGGSCLQDQDCDYNGGICLKPNTGQPNGHCTFPCTSTCPDQSGKPSTFCIKNSKGKGYCVRQCNKNACRIGYQCTLRSRFNQTVKQAKICIPQGSKPPTRKNRVVLYIGDSQSSGTRFASRMVELFRTPQKHCHNYKTKNNIVLSYTKISSSPRHWSELSGISKNWLCKASRIYRNGTASSNTTGLKLCAGITKIGKSLFQKLIETHKPNTFLIQLGGNSIGFAKSYVKSRVKRMLDQIPTGSMCFWVTHSHAKRHTIKKRLALETWIKTTVQNYQRISCSLLTSITEMSKQTVCSSFNTKDGLHMSNCGSQLWAKLITQKICGLNKL